MSSDILYRLSFRHLGWFTATGLALLLSFVSSALAGGLGTAFTYQGRLTDGGALADGNYDVQCAVYDAPTLGNQFGNTLTYTNVVVTNGLFAVQLDFGGNVFTGDARWLELHVRTSGTPAFTVLSPRQPLAPAPYALYSPTAGLAATAGGVAPNSVTGAAIQANTITSDKIAPGSFVRTGGDAMTGTLTNPISVVSRRFFNTANTATGTDANALGGSNNVASGSYAAIPGGRDNTAAGSSSLAAGRGAQANHDGTYVWADSQSAPFASTGTNQFLIRANGGVGIGTNSPVSTLQVAGIVTANAFRGDGSGLTGLTASNLNGIATGTLTFNPPSGPPFTVGSNNTAVVTNLDADLLDNLHAAAFWQLGGNSNTVPGNFLGTADNQPLELWVNNQRALRLEPNPTSPNVIGGSLNNAVTLGAAGATIGGGGNGTGQQNAAGANYATVAGGAGNTANGAGTAISGGLQNFADGALATIAGGYNNSVSGDVAAIGGGGGNAIQANAVNATISGGTNNTIQSGASFCTIGGGWRNTIMANAYSSTINGGAKHQILTGAMWSTIGGGADNTIWDNANNCTISGGSGNTIEPATLYATIAGGEGHLIQSGSTHATIGGGESNTILPGTDHATIGGGGVNIIHSNALYATIAGGLSNDVETNAASAFIGGGENNVIQSGADHAAIAGGLQNQAQANASYAVIGGGSGNIVQSSASYGTIPGGSGNVVAAPYGFAAGYGAQALFQGCFVWADTAGAQLASTTANQFVARASGGVKFFSDINATAGVQLAAGGNAWSALSDRNMKENFERVDPQSVLDKLSQLPVTEWNLKTQPTSVRHIGPMAQDFAAAFGVGEDDRHISTSDADGVALAAIQGLHHLVKEQEGEIESLKKTVADLREMVKVLVSKKPGEQ